MKTRVVLLLILLTTIDIWPKPNENPALFASLGVMRSSIHLSASGLYKNIFPESDTDPVWTNISQGKDIDSDAEFLPYVLVKIGYHYFGWTFSVGAAFESEPKIFFRTYSAVDPSKICIDENCGEISLYYGASPTWLADIGYDISDRFRLSWSFLLSTATIYLSNKNYFEKMPIIETGIYGCELGAGWIFYSLNEGGFEFFSAYGMRFGKNLSESYFRLGISYVGVSPK